MSVEKIPHMAANGVGHAKGAGGTKGGRAPQGAGDASSPDNGFEALLLSLGAGDAEPVDMPSAGSAARDDESMIEESSAVNPLGGIISVPGIQNKMGSADDLDSGNARHVIDASVLVNSQGAFAATIQAPAVQSRADELEGIGAQSTLMQAGEVRNSDSGGWTLADAQSPNVSTGTKSILRSLGRPDLGGVSDLVGLGSFGVKSIRSPKERGGAESTSPVAVPTLAAIVGDSSKLELRVVGEKIEGLGRALAQVATEALPLEVGQQAEFRRDKVIFRSNSTTTGSDVGVANVSDARPISLSLEGMAPDVGAGMTQSDQNPGTYWMSSDMKNAEMKLEGFGESPVEVSISVHGNQAHVAFRTDEVQARLALEDAGATLKDMLSKEGLDLTGVSVGTSGADGGGSQDAPPRQDSRTTRVANLTNKFPSGTSGNIVASRAGQLDVFV